MNFRFRSNVCVRVKKMAKNLVKITILFVSIYQVIQLCQATPTPNPSETTEDSTPTPSPETLNPSEVVESSPPTPSVETQIPSETDDSPTPAEPQDPSNESDNEPDESSNLTPTDPMDLNRMAFRPLLKLYGNLGPLIYTLLTDQNAIGEQMSVVSKLIVDKIGLNDYTEDMDLIFSNALNPEVREKALSMYEKIKDVHVEDQTDRTLGNAVEIIMNIFNNDEAVDEIEKIIKTSTV